MSIFRAYDIRGVYKKDLNEELFKRIGSEFSYFTHAKELIVGCDARLSSPSLKASFIKGVVATGCNVVDVGVVPSPLVYFAIAHYKKPGGAVITASHNPREYNGIKMCGKKGIAFSYESGIRKIEKAVMVKKTVTRTLRRGSVSARNITKAYADWVFSKIRVAKPLKVVVDCGNGVCGELAPRLLERAGCEVSRLFCKVDGRFPNHVPDPGKEENLRWLIKKVLKEGADLGVALDGDGDRAVFVDEKGAIVRGDVALGVFASDLLERKTGAKVIYEVKCSRALPELLARQGGIGIMSRTGHSYVHKLLVREKADLAGEMSGHYYFVENYGYDDALYAMLKMAELVSRRGKFNELVSMLPRYESTPEYRIPYPDDKKFLVVQKIAEAFKGRYRKRAVTIDGIRLELPRAWGLLRASNTEPALIARFEGKTLKDLQEVKGIFAKEISIRTGLCLDDLLR